MTTTRRILAIATLIVAGALIVGAPGQAASTPAKRAAPAYPNPQYPNHKPLRGNYPGSYTPAQPSGRRFDWLAAGVGAAGMLGLTLLLSAGRSASRIARNRRHGIPFVVDVRDDTPTTG